MITKGMMTSKFSEWETPPEVFGPLDQEFKFNLDVCATEKNRKCLHYYSAEDNGLVQSWHGHRCWMNPPYGREITKWVAKASEEWEKGKTIIVGLLPARTDTEWFWRYVKVNAQIRFIRGRIKFLNGHEKPQPAPFPSMVAVWHYGASY